MAKVEKSKIGRPTSYVKDKADRFCELIATGMSLRSACKEDDMPAPATIFKWMREHDSFLILELS